MGRHSWTGIRASGGAGRSSKGLGTSVYDDVCAGGLLPTLLERKTSWKHAAKCPLGYSLSCHDVPGTVLSMGPGAQVNRSGLACVRGSQSSGEDECRHNQCGSVMEK